MQTIDRPGGPPAAPAEPPTRTSVRLTLFSHGRKVGDGTVFLDGEPTEKSILATVRRMMDQGKLNGGDVFVQCRTPLFFHILTRS